MLQDARTWTGNPAPVAAHNTMSIAVKYVKRRALQP